MSVPPRAPIACARCGAQIAGDQAWCTECGLAARTRLARTPNWKFPLIAAGTIGLACIAALVVAFLVLTGDNAPLPTTATTTAPAAPADTVPTTTIPPATVPTTPTVPATTTPVATTPVATTPVATVPTTPTTTAETGGTTTP